MGFGLGALGVLGNAQALNPQKLFQTMGLVFMTPKSVSQSVSHSQSQVFEFRAPKLETLSSISLKLLRKEPLNLYGVLELLRKSSNT